MARLQVNPTRIELRRCKDRLKAAAAGHKLLKDKSDEMVRRFLVLSRQTEKMRQQVEEKLRGALRNLAAARAVSGGKEIEAALSMQSFSAEAEISSKSIMGVTVPVINTAKNQAALTLPYALTTASHELDQAVIKFYALTENLLKLAEIEKTCALLAIEMEKTRRRVNALEYIMIPQLQETIEYIQMKLDENERGARVRLMKVKEYLTADVAKSTYE